MSELLKILVHEPNEEFKKILFHQLETLPKKSNIDASKNDADFIKKLAEGAYDLVIMDHKAVDTKGDRLVEQIQSRKGFPKIAKFMITASHLNEAVKPTEMGEIPVTFVSKPFRTEVLESALLSNLGLNVPAKDPQWKLDARLLNPFIEAVLESFDESARISLTKKSVDLKRPGDVYDISVTSIFDQGDLFGVFSVGFPEQAYLNCFKKLTKTEDRSIHQKNIFVAEDFLKNSVAKIRQAFESRKMKTQFRSPVVTIGKRHMAPSIEGIQPIVIKFETDDELPINVEVSLQKNSL